MILAAYRNNLIQNLHFHRNNGNNDKVVYKFKKRIDQAVFKDVMVFVVEYGGINANLNWERRVFVHLLLDSKLSS